MGYELIIAEKNELVDATLKHMYQGRKTGYYYTCDTDKIYNIVNWDYMVFAQTGFILLRVLVIIVICWVLSGVINFNVIARDHRDMYNDR